METGYLQVGRLSLPLNVKSLVSVTFRARFIIWGFPDGSDNRKESACNTEDLGWIPGLGNPLEEGMATHSSILAWRVPVNRGAWWATVRGVAKSRTRLSGEA